MEWFIIILLYLVSGYIKKRQQNERKREIESDPGWDSEKISIKGKNNNPNPLDQLLNDLFEENPKIPEQNLDLREAIQDINTEDVSKKVDELTEDISYPDESDLSDIDEQIEKFDDNIYHSKLADRNELHFGKKWFKKTNVREKYFKSKQSLRESMIIKEILDRPLSLRK